MKNYEKHALLKFTLIYFLSTALFILAIGFFYFQQQKNITLQKHTMKMHQYVMKLKQSNFTHTQKGYSFKIVDKNNFKYKLASKSNDTYKKTFPIYKGIQFVLVSTQSYIIDDELDDIKYFTIVSQIVLLALFFLISLYLAKLSIKPMRDTISHIDRFTKDLIHDLNTPITAIQLNTKMLKKQIQDEQLLKKLQRIDTSTESILSLYENLEVILKDKLPKEKLDLYPILEEKIEICNYKHPNIKIHLEKEKMLVNTNQKALHRIIDNILFNACKYSKEDSTIEIIFNHHTLTIKDNGKGMKYPKKIFERSYSEDEQGHGIGMHIVQRLCDNLDIKIDVVSKENIGTTIALKFC